MNVRIRSIQRKTGKITGLFIKLQRISFTTHHKELRHITNQSLKNHSRQKFQWLKGADKEEPRKIPEKKICFFHEKT